MDDAPQARWLTAAAVAVASLMAGWLLILHLRMIVSPAPQEMREGAVVWLTRLLLEGRNPYALAELPASTNVYGIIYPLVVWPLAAVFGNGFAVHRAVSAAAIFAACGVMYGILRRQKADALVAWIGVLLFYVSSLYFVAPLARPDGLAVLLSVASMAVLWRGDISWKAFAGGLALAILALLTKPYLAFPPFVLAAYHTAFGSRPRGLAYALAAAGTAFAALAVVTLIFPTYLSLSIIANAEDTAYSLRHMVSQTRDWFVFSLPLTIAAAFALTRVYTRRASWRPNIFAFATLTNAAVFVLWLGGHPGAHMTYLFHLVTPALLPAALPGLSSTKWPRAIVALCLPVAFAANAHYFPTTLSEFSDAEATFAALSRTIDARGQVLGSTEVAGPLALAGRPVFDTGQSEYFWHAPSDLRLPGLASEDALWARWNAFVGEIESGIASRRFDTIVRSRRNGLIPAPLVARYYRSASSVNVDFVWAGQRWPVDVWEPRR